MSKKLSLWLLIGAVVAMGLLFFQVIRPFIFSLLSAAVLAVLFRPIHQWVGRAFRGHQRLAAGATTIAVVLIILLPIGGAMVLAGGQMIELGREIVRWVNTPDQSWIGRQVDRIRESQIFGWLLEFRATLSAQQEQQLKLLISNAVDGATKELYQKTQAFLADAIAFVVSFVVMSLSLYYFLADGPKLMDEARKLSPLDDDDEKELLDQFGKICRGVVMGNIMAALVQGILAGIGFAIVGVKWLWLAAGLTVFFSLIPFLGAAMVWIVVAISLALEARYGATVFMVIYGTAIVSTADNLIKAYVIGGESKLHPLIVLIAVLGAIKLIGLWGIFVGPMAAAFFYALLKILWKQADLEKATS